MHRDGAATRRGHRASYWRGDADGRCPRRRTTGYRPQRRSSAPNRRPIAVGGDPSGAVTVDTASDLGLFALMAFSLTMPALLVVQFAQDGAVAPLALPVTVVLSVLYCNSEGGLADAERSAPEVGVRGGRT